MIERQFTLAELRKNLTSLDLIERLMMRRLFSRSSASPRELWAQLIVLFTLVLGGALWLILSGSIIHLIVLCLFCAAAGGSFYWLSRAPKTVDEHLDQLLGKYQPVNVAAFRELQSMSSVAGHVSDDAGRLWVERERSAVNAAIHQLAPTSLSFTSRKV